MENLNLPPEYLTQLQQLAQRKQLAEALQKQAFNFQGAQGGGRIAAKTSPLAWLANSATGYLASKGAADAAQGSLGVLQNADQARRDEMTALLQAPEEKQQELGVQGRFKETQTLAGELYKRRQERIKQVADLLKDADTSRAVNVATSGQLPAAGYELPPIKATETGTLPDGTPFVRDFNRRGEGTTRLGGKGVTVQNNIPKAENQLSLSVLEGGLKPREDAAVAARNVFSSTNRAVDALVRGAQAGGGQDVKQILRKTLQAFGLTPPATAETEELKMALGSTILEEAAKIKPISNTDIETLRQIVGGIGTDPSALIRALAFMQAEAIRGLQAFSAYVDEQGKTITDPLARQRLAGVTVGRELPKRLFGPQSFQMGVLQALQQSGGDVSIFGTGKERFPEDATFKINPAADFNLPSGAVAKPQGIPAQPVSVDQLTPAQKAELLRLLQSGTK